MIHVFVDYAFGWRVLSSIRIMKHGGPYWGDEYDFGHDEFEVLMKHTKEMSCWQLNICVWNSKDGPWSRHRDLGAIYL